MDSPAVCPQGKQTAPRTRRIHTESTVTNRAINMIALLVRKGAETAQLLGHKVPKTALMPCTKSVRTSLVLGAKDQIFSVSECKALQDYSIT